ncbi:hypothetical protein PCANC_06255 [Puccinia coronata f. sp. avenae]|uniref:Uncharacterized protein n=1 Tax=Puccinia coronata f. sp. avenae TaxID=200324 RepID=A0A2N5V393_9BASI|nr:hypothetical protein PCANC_06255 [Puccinia coronata f. sp. avenae]
MTGDDAAHHGDARRKKESDAGTSRTTCHGNAIAETSRAATQVPVGVKTSKVPQGQGSSRLINCLSDKRSSIAARISDTHNGNQASNCNQPKARCHRSQ